MVESFEIIYYGNSLEGLYHGYQIIRKCENPKIICPVWVMRVKKIEFNIVRTLLL